MHFSARLDKDRHQKDACQKSMLLKVVWSDKDNTIKIQKQQKYISTEQQY